MSRSATISPGRFNNVVSVVVPAYNVERYLAKCLRSLLDQSCKHLEIVVVNDHSDDHTGGILDEYASQDGRIRPIHLSCNMGVHAARSAGINVASGQFIGFVDADDWVDPPMFETLLEACINADADIAICGVKTVSEEGLYGPDKVRFRRSETVSSEILRRFCRLEFGTGVLWNKLYKREVIVKFGTPPLERSVDAAEDYIVNVGCFAESRKVALLADRLYYYLARRQSASRTVENAARFVRVLGAYEACLCVYADRGEKFLAEIDGLHTRRMRFDCYKVADLSELQPYRQELRRILDRLIARRPETIYALIDAAGEINSRNACLPRVSWAPLRRLVNAARRGYLFLSGRNSYT